MQMCPWIMLDPGGYGVHFFCSKSFGGFVKKVFVGASAQDMLRIRLCLVPKAIRIVKFEIIVCSGWITRVNLATGKGLSGPSFGTASWVVIEVKMAEAEWIFFFELLE